jgi:predicted ATPase
VAELEYAGVLKTPALTGLWVRIPPVLPELNKLEIQKMIKSIVFKKDFRSFKKGDKFELRPNYNILVGDQGAGKSTLIELIRSKLEPSKRFHESDSSYRAKSIISSEKIDDIIELDCDAETQCMAFDFERESARDTSAIHYDMVSEQMFAMRASHGQGNLVSLQRVLKKAIDTKNKIDTILLDEPDAAMSPRNCYALARIFQGLVERWGKQVIVSAHNPIIINGIDPVNKTPNLWSEVLSVEDKRWMRGKDFLMLQILPKEYNEKEEKKTT